MVLCIAVGAIGYVRMQYIGKRSGKKRQRQHRSPASVAAQTAAASAVHTAADRPFARGTNVGFVAVSRAPTPRSLRDVYKYKLQVNSLIVLHGRPTDPGHTCFAPPGRPGHRYSALDGGSYVPDVHALDAHDHARPDRTVMRPVMRPSALPTGRTQTHTSLRSG